MLLAGVLLVGLLVPAVGRAAPLDPVPACGTVEGGGPAPGADVRVASYNVLHSLEDESHATLSRRVELVADALADDGANVVGAQEVVTSTTHGRVAERLATALRDRTGRTWWWCWFASNPHFPGEPDLAPGGGGGPFSEAMAAFARSGEAKFQEGLAVLSAFPISESSVRRLPPRSYEAAACVPPDPINCNAAAVFDSRSVLHAGIDVPDRGRLDLYTTHIAHGLTPLSDTTKRVHVEAALQYVDETATSDALPDVLVGDFNSTPDTDRYAAVVDAGFVDTFATANPTADGFTSDQDIREPAAQASARIDYVFARPGSCGLQVPASSVIGDSPVPYEDGWLWPSDHYGVASDLACQ